MKLTKGQSIGLGVSLAFGLTSSHLYCSNYHLLSAGTADRYRILCDAFTIPGVILLMVGLLVWISTTGMFDSLGFAFSWLGARLIPGLALRRNEKYYDYVTRKRGNRAKGYRFLYIVGGVFLAVAIVFFILFYSCGEAGSYM